MTGAVSPQRLYLFTIISSIELDLRSLIVRHIIPTIPENQLFSPAEAERIRGRMRTRGLDSLMESDLDLSSRKVDLLDYGDAISLINRHRQVLPKSIADYFREVTQTLERIIEPRNAVMHSRPITSAHVATVHAIANQLTQENKYEWKNLNKTYNEVKDPAVLMGVSFVPEPENSGVVHNLPPPDFDDTGFVGREKLLNELRSAIYGAHPVITVLGEGGLGKSAISLKAAYDLIDDPECPFELVVWVTSKVAKLGVREIEKIEGAISTSLGVIDEAITVASSAVGTTDEKDPEANIIEYMRQFRILLVIDNLETILDERIRRFIRKIPRDSKILFTSRVGAGMELPIHVGPFTYDEAKYYMRELVHGYNVSALARKNADEITKICTRLNKNPLFMKWFVLAVKQGTPPESLLGNPALALEFCMSNVFDSLSRPELDVSYSFLGLNGKPSLPELSYITGAEPHDLQNILSRLVVANILKIEANEIGETIYSMADLARAYLVRFRPPTEDFMQQLYAKRRQLRADVEGDTELESASYRPAVFFRRQKSDAVVIKILKEAMNHLRKEELSEAKNKLDRAELLSPDYFEVKRALAFYYFSLHDFQKARDLYEQAIDAAPDHAPLRHFFGGFLLRAFEDADGALKHFEIGRQLDPYSIDLRIDTARSNLYLNRFDVAEKLIAGIKEEKSLTFKTQQIVFDLSVQVHTRKAEYYIRIQDPISCLSAYKSLSDATKNIPPEFRDKRLKERFEIAIRNLHSLISTFETRGATDRVKEAGEYTQTLSHFLMVELPSTIIAAPPEESLEPGRFVGEILSYDRSKKFGFLAYKNKRWFFHVNFLLPSIREEQLVPGMKVAFAFGENEKGICAVDIDSL